MAASPRYKIYSKDGEYLASVKYLSDAGILLSVLGNGTTVRLGHTLIIYTEGKDGNCGESYDAIVDFLNKDSK